MLQLAGVTRDDLVADLGCGDGRIVVSAAKKYGCRAIGYDLDKECVRLSRESVKQEGVGKLVRIEREDIFTADLSGVTVVTLYLGPVMNARLIPQLEKLKPELFQLASGRTPPDQGASMIHSAEFRCACGSFCVAV